MHSEVHLIAAELLKLGIVPADFNNYLYQNKRFPYINYLVLALNRMEFFEDRKIAVSFLRFNDFKEYNDDETEGIIDYLWNA